MNRMQWAAVFLLGLVSGCNQNSAEPDQQIQVETAAKKESVCKSTTVSPDVRKTQSSDSGLVLEHFDRTVRPQDDLYRFANGNWLAKNQIPDDRSNFGVFSALIEQAETDLCSIIESVANDVSLQTGSPEQKVADLYNSVLDTEILNQRGIKPLRPYIDEIRAINNKKALAQYFAIVAKRGASSPIAIYINNDAKKPTEYILYMTQSGLGLPNKNYYLDTSPNMQRIRNAYVKHMSRMFEWVLGHADEPKAQSILQLESSLAEIHWNQDDNRNSEKTYNKRTTQELVNLANDFSWHHFFQGLGVEQSQQLIVRQPSYISEFNEIFKQTSLDDWKDYLTWHLISGNAGLLSELVDQENFSFYGKVLQGTLQQPPRWKRGVDAVKNLLGEVVGKVYVKKQFKPEAKQRVLTMIENLREAYRQSIVELDWMSDKTKQQALDKLDKFRAKVGYPDKWRDYSGLRIESGKLLENYMVARAFNFDLHLSKMGQSVDRDEWFMTPQTVNAYYNPVMNEIVFPAAILQPPFFSMAADDAVNYGGIGAVIGHEMGHGFDDQGATYDGDGVLRDWWRAPDKQAFGNRAQQLIEQYNQFEVLPGVFVDGAYTLSENIGDLGGLSVAYKAYQLSLNSNSAPQLDGFSGEQRFFLAWAQIWARQYREAELRRRINVDPHAPGEYRTNGVVRNMSEFMSAFDLQPGDKLYLPPEKRIQIW